MLPLLRLLAPFVSWLYPVGAIVLIIYLRAWFLASRDLRASLFSLERETAVSRMQRAALGTLSTLGCMVFLFFAQFYLGRSLDLSDLIQPTPTPEFMPHVALVSTPTPPTFDDWTPEPTSTRRPTVRAVKTTEPTPTLTPITETLETPTAEPPTPVPPANCPEPGVQITDPPHGARVQGRVELRGSAMMADFQFYKIELGLGDHPTNWSTINDVRHNPVNNGLLDVWDTTSLPAGLYSLRLVVVDKTGNYAPPCVIQVNVAH